MHFTLVLAQGFTN